MPKKKMFSNSKGLIFWRKECKKKGDSKGHKKRISTKSDLERSVVKQISKEGDREIVGLQKCIIGLSREKQIAT